MSLSFPEERSMETVAIWHEGMAFEGRSEGFSVPMDATPPLGHSYGPTPKHLLALALAGCAGMDIIGLLKKNKQLVDRFEVWTQVHSSDGEHPIIFKSIDLFFKFQGSIDPDMALHAAELSQTVYSGVSAMLCPSVPIHWHLLINGETIGEGSAGFTKTSSVYQTTFEG
jgi:putative redox protein